MTELIKSGLADALAGVQAALPRIEKSKTATVQTDKTRYSYSYADLAQVSSVILPLLGKNGLAWIAKPTVNAEGKFVLAYKLLHTSGEAEVGEYPLPTSGSPQAIGSAITYARRYCLCSVTGVAPDQDDDDAARASEETKPTRRVRPPRRTEEPDDRPKTTVRRQPPTAGPASQPPLPGEDGARVTDDQLQKMGAAFDAVGITDAPGRAEYAQKAIGREFGAWAQLTTDEAGKVIDSLLDAVEPATPPLPEEDR